MNKVKTNFDGQTICVGMDIHKSSWNLGIHLNDQFIKNVHQKPDPQVLNKYLRQQYLVHGIRLFTKLASLASGFSGS